MAKLKERVKELKEKQQKELQEVQKDITVEKIQDFPPATSTVINKSSIFASTDVLPEIKPVKKPKKPPIAFLDKYPKKKKKAKHNAVKFRLPENSSFSCSYIQGEDGIQWRGALCTPDRNESFTASHQSLHYLLTTLGQMWYKENQEKTKKEEIK